MPHFIGVSSIARKVKQPYMGVSGVARKISDGYVGAVSYTHLTLPTTERV